MRKRRDSRFTSDAWESKRADGSTDTFAARSVDIATPIGSSYLRSVTGISRSTHQRAWDWFHKIGEVHYAITRGEKIAGYAEISAHKLNADGSIGDKYPPTSLQGKVATMLQSPYGGRRGFVERFFEMMKVPGDCYLIRTRDAAGNQTGYDWLSSSELDISNMAVGDRVVRGPTGNIRRILVPKSSASDAQFADIRPDDFIGRVWRPGGQYIEVADSPMRALDTECELLYLLTIGLKGKLTNRMALNGMMILAKEITDVHTSAPKADGDVFHSNKVLNDLLNGMRYAVRNPEEAESAMPIVMQANSSGTGLKPAEMVAMVTSDRQIYETDIKQRDELLTRIIMGLDVQPQHVRGQGDSNHWSAWAVSDDERRVSIQPDIETMCWALTRLVLAAELQKAGRGAAEIEKSVLWYDLTAANVKTNLAEDSRQMRDRKLVGDEAARRMSGLEETDAPTDEELARMIGQDTGNPWLALYGLPIHDKIDWDKAAEFMGKKSGPQQESAGDPPESSPGKGAPDRPKGTATPIKRAS